MAVEPGGIATAEAVGASKAKGCIRSWKPWTWHTKRGVIYDMTGIPSAEGVGTPIARVQNRVLYGLSGISSAEAFGNPVVYSGNVIYASSPSYADVSAAIAAANPGDTVNIPAGSATWLSRLLVTKPIYLLGAGEGSTVITSGVASLGNTDNTTYWLISYLPSTPSLDLPFRLSAMTINGGAIIGGFGLFNTSWQYPQHNVRVDHLAVTNCRYDYIVYGPVYGVMDNCTISGSFINATHYSLDDSIWGNHTFTLGTADNFYVEDCTIEAGEQLVNAGWGARYCYRHNTINAHYSTFPCWDAHGNMNSAPGMGNNWSTQGIEIYENTLNFGAYMAIIVDHRGGRAAVWGNNFYNSVSAGYQIREEYYDANNPPATAPDGQPQYPSGSYYWLNRKNTSTVQNPAVASTLDYPGYPGVPQANREFWYETSPFTGASGVGVGLLSERPSSGLTVGVGYWATDTRILYRATGATTWEAFYAPYAYPHPLRSS